MFFSRSRIQEFLQEVLRKNFSDYSLVVSQVEVSPGKYGDFSTPIAFRLASHLKKSPLEIAKIFVEKIEKNRLEQMGFSSLVKIEGGGYINFFLDFTKVHQFFSLIAERRAEEFQKGFSKVSYFLEFVSANPTGPLHIGHGRWAVVGSVLSNILRWCGCKVYCEFYVNDAGVQIEKLQESVRRIREGIPLEKDHYGGDYMEVFKKNLQDPKEYFLDNQKQILSKIGVYFDQFYLESDLHNQNLVLSAIDVLSKFGMTYHQDGALWFASSKKGDEKDRVLQKQDGSYTYFAVDVAYHMNKLQRETFKMQDNGEYVTILGADHHGYVTRIQSAFDTLRDGIYSSKSKKRLRVLLGQLVSLFRSGQPIRMSKRSGEIITLEEVVEEIGVDATRYFLLQRSLDTPLSFDLDVVKKTSAENPLYYIQYAHARVCSVERKSQEMGVVACEYDDFDYGKIGDEDLHKILRSLLLFDDMVETAADRLEVHIIPTYLYELSSDFHHWYEKNRFIRDGEEDKTRNYLCVLKVVRKVLSRGLELMGICPMSSM